MGDGEGKERVQDSPRLSNLVGGALGGVARELGSDGDSGGGFGEERDCARFREGEGERRGDGMLYHRAELGVVVMTVEARRPALL
jgi:hypothetical protein